MLETIITTDRINHDPEGRHFLEFLNEKAAELELEEAIVYYDFPSYSDYDATIHRPDILLLCKNYGTIAVRLGGAENLFRPNEGSISDIDDSLNQFCSTLIGRLLKSRLLRKGRSVLKFDILPILLLPAEEVSDEDAEKFESEIMGGYPA